MPRASQTSAAIPGVAVEPVTDWLARMVGDVLPPLRWRRIGRGRSNLTYLITDAAGRALILRRPPLGELSESAHDVAREHRILQALHAVGQPVPRPLALCSDLAVTGAPFYLMERIDGVVADSAQRARSMLTPAARARAGRALAHGLADLHAVDAPAAGLADLGRGGGDFAARQIRRWTRQWRAMDVRDDRLDDLGERLAAAAPAQREVAIVHGDYALHNVVLASDGGLAAILDWELATLGEPLADLAWLLMWWPDGPSDAMPGTEPVALLEGFGRRPELVTAYVERSGRDVHDLSFWSALSYWKLAIIVEGIHRRSQALAGARERVAGAALEAARAAGL